MLSEKCFIIAEAGVNHNGDINIARRLVEAAVEAGADAIKFQTFKAENLVTKDAPKAEYQKNIIHEESQFEMLKKLELSLEEHFWLKNYCDEKKIMFLSTPFDFESVDLLETVNVPIYKVSSGDLTNIPLIKYISKKNKPIVLSTGMANLLEVEEAIEAIKSVSNVKIILLHCTSNYPTEYEDVNLNSMITLKNAFHLDVGYSDHTIGLEVPIAAVAMGARVIEKHFTLDKNMEGPDHKASVDIRELSQMVTSIRNIEQAFGDGIKKCNKNEENTKKVARKSVVAKKNIKIGEVIQYDMLTCKRPSGGILPKYMCELVGKKALNDIDKDSLITWNDIK